MARLVLINTTHGEREESTLRKVDGVLDNEHEHTTWVEYYLDDELVHRSVHVTIKKVPEEMGAIIQALAEGV